ncbi:hypothetical protein PRIPAC_85156, partial [Pristionchus pacificus]
FSYRFFCRISMHIFQSGTLKQLKKVIDERGFHDVDDRKFVDKAVKHFSQRAVNSSTIENLNVAVNTKSKTSACVMVKRASEKNRINSLDKGNTHLLSCRIFRFGWLLSVNDLKSTPNCPNGFSKRSEEYCINPYHYEPPKAKVSGVTVQKDRFPFPDTGFAEIPDDDFIPNHTLSPDNPMIVRVNDNEDEEMKSPDSNFSEDIVMEDATEITEDPKRPGLFTVPFEEMSCWMKLCYGELETTRTNILEVHGHQFTIDSSTNPTTDERLCLGYFTGMETVRDKKLEAIRRAIGKGVRMYHTGGEIFLQCLSDSPIFVQCPSANRRYGMPSSSVVKVDPKTTLKIVNYAEFANDLAAAVERGYESVYALTKLCGLRVSFVKGWGHEYSRKSIKQTGCWFTASFPAPAKWIEKVIQQMGAPALFCGSVT